MHQRFFHADRARSLIEGQVIELNSNNLSAFGKAYWPAIFQKSFEKMSSAEQREYILDRVRSENPQYQNYTSRLQSFFGANSMEEAIRFVGEIIPRPDYMVPIYEVFSDHYWSLDMNWTDFVGPKERLIQHAHDYWSGRITNHESINSDRKAPRIEVMMALPVKVGKIVAYA
jgi:hypothetical protein